MFYKSSLTAAVLITCLSPDVAFSQTSDVTTSSRSEAQAAGSEQGTSQKFLLHPAGYLANVSPVQLQDLMQDNFPGSSRQSKFLNSGGVFVDADYLIDRHWSIGARVDYFQSQTETGAGQGFYNYNNRTFFNGQTSYQLSSLTPYLTASYRQEIFSLFTLGVKMGAGLPIYDHVVLTSNLNSRQEQVSTTYSAHPFSAFGTLFGSIALTRRLALALEFGYKQLKANEMAANGEQLAKPDGSVIAVDSSSAFGAVGFNVTL